MAGGITRVSETTPFAAGVAGLPVLLLGWWATRPFSDGLLDVGGSDGVGTLLLLAAAATAFCRLLAVHSGRAALAGAALCVAGMGWVAWRADALGGAVIADGLPGRLAETDLPPDERARCGRALAALARATFDGGAPDGEDERWRRRVVSAWRVGPPEGAELRLLCSLARATAVRVPGWRPEETRPTGEEPP